MLTDEQRKRRKEIVSKIQNMLDKDKKEIESQKIEKNKSYVGKCFKHDDRYIKVIGIDTRNSYRMICLILETETSRFGTYGDEYFLYTDSVGLFCRNEYNDYEEITEKEFKYELEKLLNTL